MRKQAQDKSLVRRACTIVSWQFIYKLRPQKNNLTDLVCLFFGQSFPLPCTTFHFTIWGNQVPPTAIPAPARRSPSPRHPTWDPTTPPRRPTPPLPRCAWHDGPRSRVVQDPNMRLLICVGCTKIIQVKEESDVILNYLTAVLLFLSLRFTNSWGKKW